MMTIAIAVGAVVAVLAIVAALVAVFMKIGSKPKFKEIGEGYNCELREPTLQRGC